MNDRKKGGYVLSLGCGKEKTTVWDGYKDFELPKYTGITSYGPVKLLKTLWHLSGQIEGATSLISLLLLQVRGKEIITRLLKANFLGVE